MSTSASSHMNAYGGISFGYDSSEVFKYRDDNMCSKWKNNYQNFKLCQIKVMNNPYGNFPNKDNNWLKSHHMLR